MSTQTAIMEETPADVETVAVDEHALAVQELMQKIDHITALLAEVKAQVQAIAQTPAKTMTFGDLYGVFAGRMDVADEDLAASRLQVKDDWVGEDDAPIAFAALGTR